MKKLILLSGICIALSVKLSAQFVAFGYAEYGYAVNKFTSDQIPVFFDQYNTYYASSGLSTKFPEKIKAATGDYFKFGFGFGGEKCQMVMDFGILKARSSPMSARFGDGSGRDLILDIRNSNTDIGVRFGGTEDMPIWCQLDMNVLIQVNSIESWYVFSDGSKSIGSEHWLNGIYRDNIMTGGLGFTLGSRIYGPINLFVHGDYIPNFGRKQPDYHLFEDLNEFKDVNEYLPKDIAWYNNGGNYQMENAISDDIRGWHFTAGIQLKFGGKPQ